MGSKIFKIRGSIPLTAFNFEILGNFENLKFRKIRKLSKVGEIEHIVPILFQFTDISKILNFRFEILFRNLNEISIKNS